MSGTRKKRMSMLDTLSSAGSEPQAPMPAKAVGNRALRAARDAVDGHNVWDLDPASIDNDRLRDRLEPGDLDALRAAIETNGQTVPILVRRDPKDRERYLLVYGLRRLEAIRASDKIATVRAIIASLDDAGATRAQISENMARRDLTYIERALFARELIDKGFGTQAHIAEILTVTPSAISMALAVVEGVGRDLASAIGPAPGIGRPRWETLAGAIGPDRRQRDRLMDVAKHAHASIGDSIDDDSSVQAFEAVLRAAQPRATLSDRAAHPKPRRIPLDDGTVATLRQSSKGVGLNVGPGPFADWLAETAPGIVEELHARWKGETDS